MIRRFLAKNLKTLVLSLPVCRSSNSPSRSALDKGLAVILPVSEFCKTAEHDPEIVWITYLQLVQKLTHRAYANVCLVELYDEVHSSCNIKFGVPSGSLKTGSNLFES